ncbi:MAG: aminoacyl-tRNA hydrolase [Planctomycetes bacterium]|nr:aminoacyl-tRNA hydrolase [Planctomycetota bacterium]
MVVTERIVVPEAAIETKAVRSGGPGGQNVNKLATKIQMWIDLGNVPGFTDEERARVRAFLKSRLDARGRLLVSSQATRDQARNVEDAALRVAQLIRAALVRPKVRRRTRPTRASAERRREAKRRRAERLGERKAEWGDR